MKRLLITGADGFTGKHLRVAAEKAGYDVFALRANITCAVEVSAEIENIRPTHIAHLAAISHIMHADQEAFYKVNLFGTTNLLNALRSLPTPPEMVLLASSSNIYGNACLGLIDESICPKPVNHYAMSKLAMEHMAMTYKDDLPIVITRPFNYTGIGHDRIFVIPKIVECIKKGISKIELGNLNVYREYNDVRMVCDVYLKLMLHGISGEKYNVCSGQAYSLHEILNKIEEIKNIGIFPIISEKLIRNTEILRLVGSNRKLIDRIGSIKLYDITETLSWMLEPEVN